ncbi:MAG: helix-turn-helix domain-containing protein [Verrucomicrobiota bacterium]
MEKRLIFLALKKTGGNRNEAANLIGINVRTLRNKLKEYQGGAAARTPRSTRPRSRLGSRTFL